MSVKVYQQEPKNGKIGLVMKWNDPDGRPRQQKLNLFLLDAKTADAKLFNVDVKRQVEQLRLDKEVELLKQETNPDYPKLLDYYDEVQQIRRTEGSTSITWSSVKELLTMFLTEKRLLDIRTIDVEPKLLEDFVEWLSITKNRKRKDYKPLSASSISLYIAKLGTVINHGIRKEMFKQRLSRCMEKPKVKRKEVDYLTIEEINKLVENKYRISEIYYGFLFSIYTGLRFSDVCNLEWKNIHLDEKYIETTQQKTDQKVVIPLSDTVIDVVLSRWTKSKELTSVVFPTLRKYQTSMTYHLNKWGKQAGINKHLHFHIARHTLGVQLIQNNIDLYTVSKILGHTSVSTTEQFYADITLKRKMLAINTAFKNSDD